MKELYLCALGIVQIGKIILHVKNIKAIRLVTKTKTEDAYTEDENIENNFICENHLMLE